MALAVRVIPVILFDGERAIKGKAFDSWRSVGHLRQLVRLYDAREVDELMLLDVGANKRGTPNFDLISQFACDVFSPLAVGGGVSTVEHIRRLLEIGADKAVINTAAVSTPQLIDEAALKFGSQSVSVSIDVRDNFVYTNSGSVRTDLVPVAWAREVAERGAGEILINSIEHDGKMDGYDLDLIRAISDAVTIPVVCCGGAGKLADFTLALCENAHGVAAASIFLFEDITPNDVANHLHVSGYPVRRKSDVKFARQL
jgi:imidazole glycerol-phosphate synthase subunit HisF